MKSVFIQIAVMATCVLGASCQSSTPKQEKKAYVTKPIVLTAQEGEAVATFASGCFWCVEEVFESLVGVREVISGYAGGKESEVNPTYEQVGSGATSHAEAVQIYYNPKQISYETLVKAFFASHDPTTLNRQGPDEGTQYRSVAFYRTEDEKTAIANQIDSLMNIKAFANPIITEIAAFTSFYPAEEYHQDYIVRNPENPYVQSVSVPRFERFKAKFKGNFKE